MRELTEEFVCPICKNLHDGEVMTGGSMLGTMETDYLVCPDHEKLLGKDNIMVIEIHPTGNPETEQHPSQIRITGRHALVNKGFAQAVIEDLPPMENLLYMEVEEYAKLKTKLKGENFKYKLKCRGNNSSFSPLGTLEDLETLETLEDLKPEPFPFLVGQRAIYLDSIIVDIESFPDKEGLIDIFSGSNGQVAKKVELQTLKPLPNSQL